MNDDDDERFLKTSRNAASGDVEGFTALTKTASGNDEVSQFRRRQRNDEECFFFAVTTRAATMMRVSSRLQQRQ